MTAPPPAATETMRKLYDAELRYTDDALAELFALLDEAGLLGDAVVAVVADHGESLGENGYYFGHWGVAWQNARVPMVLAHPDGRYAGKVDGLRDIFSEFEASTCCRPCSRGSASTRRADSTASI